MLLEPPKGVGRSAAHFGLIDRSCSGVSDEWHLNERKLLRCLGLCRLCERLPKAFLQLSIGSSFCNPLDSQSRIERHMSTEFSERAPGKHRKLFYSNVLRHS